MSKKMMTWNGLLLVGTDGEVISSKKPGHKYFSDKEEMLDWLDPIKNAISVPAKPIKNHNQVTAADLVKLVSQAQPGELNVAICEYPDSVDDFERLTKQIRAAKGLFIVGFCRWDPPVAVW